MPFMQHGAEKRFVPDIAVADFRKRGFSLIGEAPAKKPKKAKAKKAAEKPEAEAEPAAK